MNIEIEVRVICKTLYFQNKFITCHIYHTSWFFFSKFKTDKFKVKLF